SFGSLFAIPLLEQVAVLLQTLIDLKIRFVITKGVLEDSIVEVMKEKVARSDGRGHLATWIPQNAVLAHKAVSFFLTHCGSNSVHEAILHEVPMIAWPGTVDQVTIALELSLVHKVAFELLQVRTGSSISPPSFSPAAPHLLVPELTLLHSVFRAEFNIGRPTARGPNVVGTPEAIREELIDVVSRMNGAEGEEMRVGIKKMRETLVDSRKEGRSRKAMLALGRA
ncbi:hypothetical protein BDY24DRAFT_424087, partial [Mrakia frigida]|uniref:uncharacterized protein n=1 Tax=Mrakia frigida TaxID=29902 RepID=UPI003FCBF78D